MAIFEDSSLWTEFDLSGSASVDSFDSSNSGSFDSASIAQWVAGLGTFGSIGCSAYGCLAETARESGSAIGELLGVSGAGSVVSVLIGTFGSCSEDGDSSASGEVFDIWQDSNGKWHINDVVPYSRVEARAAQIYSKLHRNEDSSMLSFPAIVTESNSAAETIHEIFGAGNADAFLTKLSVFENLLNMTAHNSENEIQ